MNCLRKAFLTLAICVVFFSETALYVSAAGGTVVFYGREEGFSFLPGSGYSDSDLFSEFKHVMPGDILNDTVTVKNKMSSRNRIRILLSAVPHSVENVPVCDSRPDAAVEMNTFLSQLKLRIYREDTLLYDHSPHEPDNLRRGVYLGTLGRNGSLDLKLELEVPAHLDNRFSGRIGEVDWIFTAEILEDTSSSDVPKTGDFLRGAVLCLAASAVLLILLLRKKYP